MKNTNLKNKVDGKFIADLKKFIEKNKNIDELVKGIEKHIRVRGWIGIINMSQMNSDCEYGCIGDYLVEIAFSVNDKVATRVFSIDHQQFMQWRKKQDAVKLTDLKTLKNL